MDEFVHSEYYQRLNLEHASAVSARVKNLDHYVKQATRSQQVTLFPCVWRGLDFDCYDKTVAKHGGVAVVQTFLAEHVTEEIHIKGRTCRHGEKGSWQMVLLD